MCNTLSENTMHVVLGEDCSWQSILRRLPGHPESSPDSFLPQHYEHGIKRIKGPLAECWQLLNIPNAAKKRKSVYVCTMTCNAN